ASAPGLMLRLEKLLAANPDRTEVNNAVWQASHRGQRRAAEVLLRHGADVNSTVTYHMRQHSTRLREPTLAVTSCVPGHETRAPGPSATRAHGKKVDEECASQRQARSTTVP